MAALIALRKVVGKMSYRMSMLPAETFFSKGVFLVEGSSEVLFYNELATELRIDLDFDNVSIRFVGGIAFEIYIRTPDALAIPWVMRIDKDISKLSNQDKWQYKGINRCLKIAALKTLEHSDVKITAQETIDSDCWQEEKIKGYFFLK